VDDVETNEDDDNDDTENEGGADDVDEEDDDVVAWAVRKAPKSAILKAAKYSFSCSIC
jgi:hypothetical protein